MDGHGRRGRDEGDVGGVAQVEAEEDLLPWGQRGGDALRGDDLDGDLVEPRLLHAQLDARVHLRSHRQEPHGDGLGDREEQQWVEQQVGEDMRW